PFAVAVQALITLLFTALAPAMHKADQFALEANYRGIEWINYLGVAIHFIFNAFIAFLPIYFGAEKAGAAVEVVPEWIIDGLSIALIGLAIALYDFYQNKKNEPTHTPGEEELTDGI